jgi:ATP synthase protein I
MSVQSPTSSKPYLAVLKWQALVTGGLAFAAGLWAGGHGALSAILGGLVNITAGVVYAVVVLRPKPATAGRTMTTLFRAEASKILVIIAQLWMVLATYRDVVLPAFLAAFVITVLLSSVALFVRD